MNVKNSFKKVPEFGYIKLLGAKATDDLGLYDTLLFILYMTHIVGV